ncbi:MAG TPA: hypothetical protein VFO34_12660 [Candidatus Acidoferrales bacterium]|nr:hypothetical protein [Candidatus Acidoferrales bacterium]
MKNLLLVMLLLSTIISAATDVTGKWSGTLKAGENNFPCYLTLKQDGGTLSGTMGSGERDQKPIQDGKIEGSVLHFRVPSGDGSGTQYAAVELHLENEELVGTIESKDQTGQMRSFPVSLKRANGQ